MNFHEDGLIKNLDQQKALQFARPLVNLFAARIISRTALQKYVADLVHDRIPGAPGSLLEGTSQQNIWQIRSRLVRELFEAVKDLAKVSPDPVQRAALKRFADAIARSLPQGRTPSKEGNAADETAAVGRLDIGELLQAWVRLMKELGIRDIDFLIPGRLGWLTLAETS
jgi:hypothetical protein